MLLSTAFNTLTSHYGETVLFTIPGNLPLLSGPVTLEAMVYGATNGLVLTGMLASFMVLNLALTVRELISLIPQAFFPMAVVTSIAVTYLPTTLRQFRQIREAQAIRGHQMRTLRDWLPLWMPLLVGGLEHAMQLAEAMTARGFASASPAVRKGWNYATAFYDHRVGAAGNRMDFTARRCRDDRTGLDHCGDDLDAGRVVVSGQGIGTDNLSQPGMGLAGLADRDGVSWGVGNLHPADSGFKPRVVIL